MRKLENARKQSVLNFIILIPMFFAFSILFPQSGDAKATDFASYWQAGHMILNGQNVYDSTEWIAVHDAEQTAYHSEKTFQYPLPFAVFFALLALFPIQFAYLLWTFLAQIGILVSVNLLLSFYPERPRYLDLLAIAGVFLFRPTFPAISNGQIVPFLLFLLSVSIRLFHDERWLSGGLVMSALSLKPSIGIPILVLAGVWLLAGKQWRALAGMALGGLTLALMGVIVNYRWVIDYLSIGGDSFQKYFGMQPTMWGLLDRIFETDKTSLMVGIVCAAAVLGIEAYLFWKYRTRLSSYPAFATILPAMLFIAPYSWNYDQILLAVPIIFLLMHISREYGMVKAVVFILGVLALAYGTVVVAYSVGHDVWSFLITFLIWMFSIYFVEKSLRMQTFRMTAFQ